jgi:hypothetical protein
MIDPSFYGYGADIMDDFFEDKVPHLPKHVILDMAGELGALMYHLNQLDHLGVDMPTVIADVLDQVNVSKDADHNLSVSAHEIQAETADGELANDTAQYLEVREKFSKSLLQQLRDLQLYVRGMLYYELKSVQYGMLVLQKLQVPILELERDQRRLARQADLVSRQYRPRPEQQAPQRSIFEEFGVLQPGRLVYKDGLGRQ